MSSTRYRAEDAPFRPEAYASSNAHELGLPGNMVARRCKVAMRPEHRIICYFIQQLSHRDGGLKRVVSEIIAAFPERFQTAGMAWRKITPGQTLRDKEREEFRSDFPDFVSHRDSLILVDGICFDDKDSFPLETDGLFALCREAAVSEMETALRAICLDPEADLEQAPFRYHRPGRSSTCQAETWWIDDIVGTIELFRQKHIRTAKEAIAETTVSNMVHKAINTASYCRGLAVVEGDQRTGKTTAAANYCATHPGETVYITLEEGKDETTFFRSIARSIGTASSGQLKAIELRGKIEDMLQAGHLTVVIDEAHFLVPIIARPKSPPKRLDWVRCSLLDKGVPVVLVSTPQFDRQCEHYEKHLSWNSKQLRGRLYWQKLLPSTLPVEEIMAVARKIAPHASGGSIARLAAYAVDSTEYLFGIERIVKLAGYIAESEGRTVATREDIQRALDEVAPAKLSAPKQQTTTAEKKPCKRRAAALQTSHTSLSRSLPPALARRALMDSPASEEAGFEASDRLQFTGAVALE